MSENSGKPNILLLMVDQMTVRALSIYGNRVAKLPHLEKLASDSMLFENAYCASPLCAPARFSLLTGKQSAKINAFDNASEFPAATPTLPHYLRSHGYFTVLCGKMHFIGPDQMHGFNKRMTTDIYPASYAWVPQWDKGASFITSGVTCASILESGPCIRSMQMDYDDEVEYRGIQTLYDLARSRNRHPFFLTVSFSHPHHPFTISREFWDRYAEDDIDLPEVGNIPFAQLDYHSRGLYFAHGRHLHKITQDSVIQARHAYYGMLSYVDDKIGRLLDVLNKTGLADNTLVIFTSDHGEMLGERGMWHKHHFYDATARVPLTLRLPGKITPSRISAPVSHIDLMPTILNMVDGAELPDNLDGTSLAPVFDGTEPEHAIFADYLAIGPCVPCRMVRCGEYKYMYTHHHDEQLFNLSADPYEIRNLANEQAFKNIKADLKRQLFESWDPSDIDTRVRVSQRRRTAINNSPGEQPTWDYIYHKGDHQRFVRNRKVDDTKGRFRLPRIEPVLPNQDPMSQTQISRAMETGMLS